MLGLIGLIIANQSSLHVKSPCRRDIYVGPPTFFLGPALAPSFFHSRVATGWCSSRVVPNRWVAEECLLVTNSSLSSLLKVWIFRTAHTSLNIVRCISKTEAQIYFCEVHIISVIIPIRCLLCSFDQTCRYTPPLEKVSTTHWCWDYTRLVYICPAVNTYQLKFQQNTTNIINVKVPYYIHCIVRAAIDLDSK